MDKRKLYFTLISKTKDLFGVWEICIQLGYKEYTYIVSSSYAVEQFEKYLRKRRYGLALNVLKRFKISLLKKNLPVPANVKETNIVLGKVKSNIIKSLRVLDKSYVSQEDKMDVVEVLLTDSIDRIATVRKEQDNDTTS